MTSPLFVDTFSGAKQTPAIWSTLVAAGPPWHGAIIKATQGTNFSPSWFLQHWPVVKDVAGVRYGVDWFRGAYHFMNYFGPGGAAQADFYLNAVDKAGGWDVGDFWPICDVELGNNDPAKGPINQNNNATSQQIIDYTSAFAERCKQLTGRAVMLYGNGAMREKGIKNRMSCDWLWCPRYTAQLPREIYERAGWTTDRLALWQYAGDGVGGNSVGLVGYPSTAPGLGTHCDISVLTIPDGIDGLRSKIWAENPNSATSGGLIAAGVVGGIVGAWAFARGVLDRWFTNTR